MFHDDAEQKYKIIIENVKEVCYNVSEAIEKYRKSYENVRIMAVTKTVAPELVNIAVDEGITLLGENRVQEFLEKKDMYRKQAEVHFIGHLQTNKVKYIVNDVTMIQSVDSLKLANEINRLSAKNNKVMDVLVEINIGDELTKSGVDKHNVFSLVEQMSQLENIKVKGLMTIPPPMCDESVYDEMHKIFLELKEKELYNVDMDILSMGMSGDYVTAIKHGSNLVRIGTKLFGARNIRR